MTCCVAGSGDQFRGSGQHVADADLIVSACARRLGMRSGSQQSRRGQGASRFLFSAGRQTWSWGPGAVPWCQGVG